jgi:predicted nucleic-acid-binding protein
VIGLDTNVLVRYLAQDEPDQAARAARVMEQTVSAEEPGFIGLVVLVETVWVLQRLYRATADEIAVTVGNLLGSPVLVVERRDVVARAVAMAKQTGARFGDALIAAAALEAGCARTVTFDRRALRAGMTLVD